MNNQMKKKVERMSNLSAIAPNLLPGVKADDLINVRCNNCGGEVFSPSHLLKFASRFQSRNGTPTMVQFPLGFYCITCQQINPFDIDQLSRIIEDIRPTDQDGQKLGSKEEKESSPPDLGVAVDDGIKTKEKLN